MKGIKHYRIESVQSKGFGHRLWLPAGADRSLQLALDRLSLWGAIDRRMEGWISWEIHSDQLFRVMSELQSQGFTKITTSATHPNASRILANPTPISPSRSPGQINGR